MIALASPRPLTEGPKIARRCMRSTSTRAVKTYAKPFTPSNHDALSAADYIFTYFKGDEILPLTH